MEKGKDDMIKDNWKERYANQVNESVSSEFFTLVKLHNEIAKATFMFFADKGMQYVPVPATTGAASSPMEPGSDSEPVVIQVKNRSTKLTDSAQFHLEYTCRSSKVGSFFYGHSFRDEEPDDRHLAQFNHAEAEIVGTLEDVKRLVEQYVKYITKFIWRNLKDDLNDIPGIENRVHSLLSKEFVFQSISYKEACKTLEGYSNASKRCESGSFRISPKGEKILMEKLGEFIWIECWDRMAVPFYQAFNPQSGFALNADLLFGIGEVVGAGQRHFEANSLLCALDEHGLSVDDYKWYVDMKRQYPLQTSGFGMGVERYLMWLLNIQDIRSVEVFTRNRFQIGEI